MMVFVSDDRERLRTTFNSAASLYHQARPEYPAGLFDELVRLAGLRPGDRLLEVGCATGKATIPLARRGFRLTCVELGAGLAAEARRNLGGFPQVSIVNGAFESWEPPQPGFDLVFAATAWHWIDPARSSAKTARPACRCRGQVARRCTSHTAAPSTSRVSATKMPASMDWNSQKRPAGW